MLIKRISLAAVILLLGLAQGANAGLVGHWTFDEGSGDTAHDSSGNGHHGTVLGNPEWVPGAEGFAGALAFSPGKTEGVDCGVFDPTNGTGKFTIAYWAFWGGTGTYQHFLTKSNGWGATTMMFQVELWGAHETATYTDRVGISYQGAGSVEFSIMPKNEWVHLAWTFDGTDLTLYMNGVDEVGPKPFSIGPNVDAPVLIGTSHPAEGRIFEGTLDDFWIFDQVLAPDEISELMSGEPLLCAYAPTPADGTMIEQTQAMLQWRAGEFAALHDVYFGQSADDVSAATPDDAALYVGRQAAEMLPVGVADAPAPDGLVPGETYYWRVDEVNDTRPDSPWPGSVWSFEIRPVTAWKPFPVDEMNYVGPDQDLSWEAGTGALFHIVYFGESFDEVNEASAGGWMIIDALYDPGALELDKTYYWRVDESSGLVTHKGEVWSFTTRGEGGGVKAEYFGGMDLAGDPVLTQVEGSIDHSWGNGDVAPGLADNVSARWTACLEAPLTETYKLITTSDDGVRLWLDGRLIIDNWTDHSTTDNTARVDLVAGQFYSIKMEYYENDGGAVAQLSWESPSIPRQIIPQGWLQLPLRAGSPSPAHLEPHAVQTTDLCWTAGDEATGHDVYFGDDCEAVANADTTSAVYRGRQAADVTCYDPGPLEWGKTYCWRVDEINADGTVLAGAVWSFTTADFLLVDDFESYDDADHRIYQIWIDGVENNTGSYVGYDVANNGTFGETSIVHGGDQSMPLAYDNTVAPFYSETSRTWTPPQNWTANGIDTLTLWFRGKSDNAPEALCVALEDNAGNIAVVPNPDPDAVLTGRWTEWNIPLSDFAGVNAAAIKTIYIGVGNRAAPTPGGAGTVYIDDIRVTRSETLQ